MKRSLAIIMIVSTTAQGALADAGHSHGDTINITESILTNRSADCGNYVGSYVASATDEKNQTEFMAQLTITATETECAFISNSVPNHNFNDASADFAGGSPGATISEVESIRIITRNPAFADEPTFISQQVKNAIFLNGVLLDILSAGCYRPDSPDAEADGNIGIGCQSDAAWLLDPLGTESKFGADAHNAHTQPGGLYHYHGNPNALFDNNPGPDGSPVIGFAADGFPVYGSYFRDPETGKVRKAQSGYSLREGTRGAQSDSNPGGQYTGQYNDDWEFTDAGDLDVCNGMTLDGQYGYYVTDSYPWVIKCLKGTPADTFIAQGRGGDQGPPPN
ncbi:MAG: YHYH protein [Pseudoruegeria sp.]